MGPQLSWLERTTDNREVGGSSPLGPTIPFLEVGFKHSEECLKLVSRNQYRTLKTEQSNSKYEEQATEGNKRNCGTFLI